MSALIGNAAEIVDGSTSGGTNTSHTIGLAALRTLLGATSSPADLAQYQHAVLVNNVLGKATEGSRMRTFRYLRELYLLRPSSVLFRALRDLWSDDDEAQPLLAGLCALARDTVFRVSADAILESRPDDVVTSVDLALSVEKHFPDSYSQSTLAKVGRNTLSSWEQTGHLAPRRGPGKKRIQAICRPADVAYALMLGHLQGVRGQGLFETLWTRVLDVPKSQLMDQASAASQHGFIEFRSAGGVIEVGFRELLRPMESGQGVLL